MVPIFFGNTGSKKSLILMLVASPLILGYDATLLPHRLIDKAAHFCIIRDEMVITRHFAYPDIFEWEPCFLI